MTPPVPPHPDVIIVGGGLAGMAAGVTLADQGRRVVLLEAKKRLGGRATSLTDPRTGEEIDNCQHVAMGCCTSYLGFLKRVGTLGKLVWTRDQWWIEPGGRRSRLSIGRLPPPLHTTPSFLASTFLGWADKLRIGLAIADILRTDRETWRGRPFSAFLDRTRQSWQARERFWNPVIVGAINLPPDRADAEAALHVFEEAMLGRPDAGRIAVSGVPLAQLYAGVQGIIENAGGRVLLASPVSRLGPQSVVLRDGTEMRAGGVISALPFERLLRVVGDDIKRSDPRFAQIDCMTHSPIVGVHILFDRPVLDVPHAVLVGQCTHWLFRKNADGSRIHAVISAADMWVDLSEDDVVTRVTEDMRACLPASEEARMVWGRTIKEKRATFALTPEVGGSRPTIAPPERGGVIISGDFTRTGWPATMEGAVRSGVEAAMVALDCLE